MPRTTTLLGLTATTMAVGIAVGVAYNVWSATPGRRPAAHAPATTKPAAAAEATVAAAELAPTPAVPRPERPLSVLSLDGHDTPFPAANLTVTRGRGGLHAILCTDDPPAAMESGYAGNSFMFDMRLAADAAADLPAVAWDYKDGSTSDATGIFLHGDRDQLQPAPGVRITFQKDGNALLAFVSGPFVHLDNRDPTVPPERVQVFGCVRCLAAER